MTAQPKWSRRRWIAESTGSDLSELSEHQPSLRGSERRLPIYSDGTLYVCQLPGDSREKLARTLEGRSWKARPSWRDPSVVIHEEQEGGEP